MSFDMAQLRPLATGRLRASCPGRKATKSPAEAGFVPHFNIVDVRRGSLQLYMVKSLKATYCAV
jgi:hypothetical protein